jgi:hypothetical protein
MFAPSPQLDLLPMESTSISSAEVSRVRTSASPAVVTDSTVSARSYGTSSPELLARFDPASSSWRTPQRCLEGGFSEFSETLPRSGLMRNGIAYRLPTLARRISATGRGLLPTPTAMGGGGSSRSGDRIDETPTLQGMARKGMLAGVLFPTPTANQYGTTNNGKRGDGTTYRTAGTPSLATMASRNLWPTPTTGDARSSGSRNTPASKAHPGVSLTDAVRGDMGTGRIWPTPAARDFRHPNRLPYSERGGGTKGEQLPNAVGGALNPTWVEWLMGYPSEWTVLDASEIPSSRRSSKRSALRS